MFGIGMQEMLLILVVALIVIGPKKLPDLAKTLGKAMGELKRATAELKDAVTADADLSPPVKSQGNPPEGATPHPADPEDPPGHA